MKGIIIYSGKYGATKQYAEWLGEELALPVATSDSINGNLLQKYDFLLLGSSVYIGKMKIKKWLKKNLSFIIGKKIFLFQVAGATPEEKQKRETYNRASIPGEILNSIESFFLPGRMIMKNLSWGDRFLLKIGARLSKDSKEKKSMLTDYDGVNKASIAVIAAGIKSYLRRKTIGESQYTETVQP